MRVLVVDDEAPARRRLRRLLDQLEDVEVVGEAGSGRAALDWLASSSADLMFLDIEMPGLDGMTLAARTRNLPLVVFVTAHDAHAARAFELDALDYVMKPVVTARLVEALRRARVRLGSAAAPYAPTPSVPPRIVVHDAHELRVFDATRVIRFRASNKYTTFVLDGCEQLTEEPLSTLEVRLRGHGFVRVHRSELVRASAIEALGSDEAGAFARLSDGQTVRVSRRTLPELRRELLARGT